MPGNLAAAAPSGVLPQSLCTAFSESRLFPILSNQYHDGTTERGLVTDVNDAGTGPANGPASIRTWKQSKRLNAADLGTLRTFFEHAGGSLGRWYFYDPYDVLTGHAVGSNYDASGTSTQGRKVCQFLTQAWMETVGLGRSDTAIEFLEVA